MRLLWLSPLFLASICLSTTPAVVQPPQTPQEGSCGAFPTEQASSCSVKPALLREPREVKDSLYSTPEFSRSKRSAKHKHRAKHNKGSRVERSAREDFEAIEDDASPKPNYPKPIYFEDNPSLPLQGDWKNVLKQIQAYGSLPAPRFCPHCRQLLPPEQTYLHQSIDPRMLLPMQQIPRFQAIPLKSPLPVFEGSKDFSTYDETKPRSYVPEEFCPFNYRMTMKEDETQTQDPPDFYNQTSSRPNKFKEFKKTPAGLSDRYMDEESYDEMSPAPPFKKMELVSFLKQSNIPTMGELTKHLDKKRNS